MTKIIASSKQGRRADVPMLPGVLSAEELGVDRSPARLIERVIVEYARAWRNAHPQTTDPLASGTY